jgi:5-methylcytosine-specific restriction protein A
MLKPCSVPGCPKLSPNPRCDQHSYQRERERGKTAERGYDRDHRRLRVLCFQRDNWRCVDCGWEPELVEVFRSFGMGPAPVDKVLEQLRSNYANGARHLHADHIIPIEKRPDLRLDLDNLATRCDRCHNARTMRGTNARVTRVTRQGQQNQRDGKEVG